VRIWTKENFGAMSVEVWINTNIQRQFGILQKNEDTMVLALPLPASLLFRKALSCKNVPQNTTNRNWKFTIIKPGKTLISNDIRNEYINKI
jgi:hypothetical protein